MKKRKKMSKIQKQKSRTELLRIYGAQNKIITGLRAECTRRATRIAALESEKAGLTEQIQPLRDQIEDMRAVASVLRAEALRDWNTEAVGLVEQMMLRLRGFMQGWKLVPTTPPRE